MLDEAIGKVKKFHELAKQPIAVKPQLLKKERVEARARWMNEEIEELRDATDLYQQADAIMDLLYYLLGVFVEMGISADDLFDIIHQANMEKLILGNKIIQDEDLKVKKPCNWKHPDELIKFTIDNMWQRED